MIETFLKLNAKLGFYHVVLTAPKTSPEKLTLTVIEIEQLPDIEKTDPKKDCSCRKWTIHSGMRKVCVKFKTNIDMLKNVL